MTYLGPKPDTPLPHTPAFCNSLKGPESVTILMLAGDFPGSPWERSQSPSHFALHFFLFIDQLSKSFIICQIWVQTSRKEQRVLDSFVLRMYLLKMEYHTYNPHPWHISTYPRDKFFLVDQTQKDRQSSSLSCS